MCLFLCACYSLVHIFTVCSCQQLVIKCLHTKLKWRNVYEYQSQKSTGTRLGWHLNNKTKHQFHITTLHKYCFFILCFYSSYTYMYGCYVEVVFNFVAKIPSQSCSCTFSVFISLHTLSF